MTILCLAMITSCLSCSAVDDTWECVHAHSLIARMNQRLNPPRKVFQPDGSFVLETSSIVPAFALRGTHSATWIHVEMEEESELRRLGVKCLPALLEVVRDPTAYWELRCRLALVIGKLKDFDVSPYLLTTAREDLNPYVRYCAWTGLGLLQSPQLGSLLANIKPRDVQEKKRLLWCKGMGGSDTSMDEYCRILEDVLASEELEHKEDPTGPAKLTVSDAQKHLDLQAKLTPASELFHLDLWCAASVPTPRVLKLLVDSLQYHDSHVQHMAFEILKRDVDRGPEINGSLEFDLHTLEVHLRWLEWWNVRGKSARWDPLALRFRVTP